MTRASDRGLMRCFCGHIGPYPLFRCHACRRLLISPAQVKAENLAPLSFIVRATENVLSERLWSALPEVLPDGAPRRAIWYRKTE